MQAQTIIVFLAHALVLASALAQQSMDASCERYASRIGIYAHCDAREFFEPTPPVSDISLEAALAARLASAEQMPNGASATAPPTENPLGGDNEAG